MIQSKFNSNVYWTLPFIIGISTFINYFLIHFEEALNLRGRTTALFLLPCMNFLLIHLTAKTQKFSTDTNQIFVDGFLGLGITKVYALNEISGYYTGTYSGKYNTEIITYITIRDKKVARLSSIHHTNYKDIMAFIEGNLTKLGPLKITAISELKSTINPKHKIKI